MAPNLTGKQWGKEKEREEPLSGGTGHSFTVLGRTRGSHLKVTAKKKGIAIAKEKKHKISIKKKGPRMKTGD